MEDSQKITIDDSIYDDAFPIMRSKASSDRTFIGFNGDNSIKSTFTRSDYDYIRENFYGKSRKGILKSCQEAYEKVSIISNVINLMSDFGSKGIRIRHSDEKLNKFLEKWSKKVKVAERTERILNSLYRLGTVIIYETYGRATNNITSKYIPIKYTLLNPISIEVKGEDKGIVPSNFEYLLKYSQNFSRILKEQEAVQAVIPEELKKYYNSNTPLPKERITVYNYRKDDWAFWGLPITYPLLDDLKVLQKLKLSDIAALDGAISTVRLWTVGQITDNPATTIIPTKPMLQKVANMIANGVGGGSMDLVLGPEVKFQESSTSVHQFLGEDKYKPTLDSIYDGLGIPSPLRSSNKDNNTGNTVSLKTLIERLNYGRMYIVEFWTEQVKKVFKALGFDTDIDPIIEFDYMILTDEAAEKKLLLDMIDRDIVDIATVQERLNLSPEIIKANIRNDMKTRGNKDPLKAGPYHNPHVYDEMTKSLVANGTVLPGEAGIPVKVADEEVSKRIKANQKSQKSNQIGAKKQSEVTGRPKNITETSKRKPKPTKAIIWASKAQKEISEQFTPLVLKAYGKKNVRSLSDVETESLEQAKMKILFGLEPFSEITLENIQKSIASKVDISKLNEYLKECEESYGELTVDLKRQLTSLFYGEYLDGQD